MARRCPKTTKIPAKNLLKKKPEAASNPLNITHHTVLVLDDGFDKNQPVFEKKVTATYTITCSKENENTNKNLDYDQYRKKFLEDLKANESTCSIKSGISFRIGPDLKKLEGDKNKWNEDIKGKKAALSSKNFQKTSSVLHGSEAGINYHGTNTSGIIGYDNADTKLVLVQIELASSNQDIIEDESACPEQSELDLYVRVLKDKEVRKAYVTSAPDELTKKLTKIAADNKVTLVNLSLGSSSRQALEQLYVDAGCKPLNYKDYYTEQGKIDSERSEYLEKNYKNPEDPYILTVQAAGNDGSRIDDLADSRECSDRKFGLVLVGAVDTNGKKTKFTNYGKCVDYYTLGKNVVVQAPGGFLNVADGTSFSAPLLVRYISKNIKAGLTFKAMIKELDQLAGNLGYFPSSIYPEELAFDNNNDKISGYTLSESAVESPRSPIKVSPKLIRSILEAF